MAAGRQAYVVCPLIEESEKLEVASASLVSGQTLKRWFGERLYPPWLAVLVVAVMQAFSARGALSRADPAYTEREVQSRMATAVADAIDAHVRGDAALFVPGTAITDYATVTRALAADLVAGGGELRRIERAELARAGGDGERKEGKRIGHA